MSTELGTINDRWRLHMTPDRVEFHKVRPPWEQARLASMFRSLATARVAGEHAGPVVYDVGAECGDFSALYGTWGCEVVCIEPQPRYWPSIKAHFEGNDLTSAASFVGFAAAGELDGYLLGRGLWPACADGPIEPDVGFLHLAVTDGRTPTITLDRLAEPGNGPPPDAITIDVEGAEYRVLVGAQRILAEQKPLVWVSIHTDLAWMDEQYPGEGREAVLGLLEGHGYRWESLGVTHEEFIFAWPSP